MYYAVQAKIYFVFFLTFSVACVCLVECLNSNYTSSFSHAVSDIFMTPFAALSYPQLVVQKRVKASNFLGLNF